MSDIEEDVLAAAPPKSSSLKTRVIVSLFLIPLALTGIWLGGVVFNCIIGAGALLIAREWSKVTGLAKGDRVLMLTGLAMMAGVVAAAPGLLANWAGFCLFLGASILLVAIGHQQQRPDWQWQGFGLAYIAPTLIGLIWLRDQSGGIMLVLWLFLVVWATDVGGYFVGRSLGGAKLAPELSPNKTWSGFLGGMALAMLTGLVFSFLYGGGSSSFFIVASGALAVVSQLGDLFESALKRQFRVKDSGRLLPGHGGVMDRLDGLMFAAPVAVAGVVLSRSMS